MDELNVSPATIVSGAVEVMFEAVGFVKFKSYDMETSPAEVKLVGILEVTAVSETEKREVPLSVMLKRFEAVPFVPMLMRNKSPVAVVAEPGDQSRVARPPVESTVEVDERFNNLPVVREVEDKSKAVPVAREL